MSAGHLDRAGELLGPKTPALPRVKPKRGQKQAMEMPGLWKGWKAIKPAFHPSTPLENPCGDSHITTASATTIMYLKTGKARRKPAIRATLTARGL